MVEQGAHVVDGIDGDAGHADIAGDARVVGIVAAVGGEVEGDGHALLTGSEIAAVEGVRILGGGEAGILPDRPGPLHIHGGVGAAEIRCDTRKSVEKIEPRNVLGAINWRHRDTFRCQPGRSRSCRSAGAIAGVESDLSEVGDAAHAPNLS